MKTIALGDIHGRTIWKQIVEKHKDANRIIFIGDYFDTHEKTTGEEQLNNFLDICEYKKQTEKEIILLIGNHDYQYFPGITESCRGYQMWQRQYFEKALNDNKNLLQMCFADENEVIFSHAGISKTFCNLNEIDYNKPTQEIVNAINDLWIYRPMKFGFSRLDMSGYGEHTAQSCTWIRTQSLYSDKIKQLQVVGHTSVNKIDSSFKSERRGFYLIDALGTTQEYLIVEDKNIQIGRI